MSKRFSPLRAAATTVLMLGLAGCGGDGDGDSGPSSAGGSNVSTGSNAPQTGAPDAFLNRAIAIIGTTSETAEPADIGSITGTTPENTYPAPVS